MSNNTLPNDKVPVIGNWLVKADRASVYKVISDFGSMPAHFPAVAKQVKIISSKGNELEIEAVAGSFGRLFPDVKIDIHAELLPGRGYKCKTFNRSFNTTGEEELLLEDDPLGTRIKYTYIVTVKNKLMRPLFAWLVRKIGLSFWKRSVIDRLNVILSEKT